MVEIHNYLRNLIPNYSILNDSEIEHEIVEYLLSTPYDVASEEQINEFVSKNYCPGLFYITERKEKPAFLLEENQYSYEEWIFKRFASDLEQIQNNSSLSSLIANIGGTEIIVAYCLQILTFKTHEGLTLEQYIINQEYSDFFRRIIVFLITGNPFYIVNNNFEFNELGKKLVTTILKSTVNYSLEDRLFQSIASGMLGMDIKEKNIHTAPINLDSNLTLKEDHLDDTIKQLEAYIHSPHKIGINCFPEFYQEVIQGNHLSISWFTDDYIETMFELKLIEELLIINGSLKFTIIPRYDSYSNDASYHDILDMLQLHEFARLHTFYEKGRLIICRNGMDISSVDFRRMSSELYAILKETDICVISGARAFEMTQGLKCKTYYTGIAVCKSYTETITGFSKKNGTLIFLKQDPGDRSFFGFKERHTRFFVDGTDSIHVSTFTAKEYYLKRLNKYSKIYSEFKKRTMDKVINKLVRDNIPNIILNNGQACTFCILEKENEYIEALDQKILEETAEYIESHDILELADLLEVIYACADTLGFSPVQLEEIRQKKVKENGSFSQKIYLQTTSK